jgi:hypothetical protein
LQISLKGLAQAISDAESGTAIAVGRGSQAALGGATRAAGDIPNPLAGINAIGDFFNRLTQPNTWIRVGEVAAGLLLIYLGLSATMRGTEAARQYQSAKRVTKKAVGTAIAVAPK